MNPASALNHPQLFASVVLILIVVACVPAFGAESALRKTTHVYKTVGNVKVHADVYRPVDAKVRPVLVWIHGGALIVGSRASVPRELLELCKTDGIALVSLDYRLAPEVKLPEIISDIKDAFIWLSESAASLGVDTKRMIVAGGSAGGYLTLMTGFAVKPKPTALVAYWGYGDITADWYAKPSEHYRTAQPLLSKEQAYEAIGAGVITATDERGLSQKRGRFYLYLRQNGLWIPEVSGFDPLKEADKLVAFCPERNIKSDYPPTLLIHGTVDTDVPYEQSVGMARELARRKVAHELITVAGAGHGLAGGDKKLIAAANAKAAAFIREYMKSKTPD